MTDSSIWVFGAGLVIALAYLPLAPGGSSALRSLIKTVPLLLFAAVSMMVGAPPLLTAALVFSALGDLALSRDGNAAFLYGLAAFALAHFLYILVFWGASGTAPWDAFFVATALSLAMVAIALSTELWLTPHTNELRWPVRIYVVLIGVMVLSALTLPPELVWVTIGAALFFLSDLILSILLFRMHDASPMRSVAGWAVWIFYVGGQALILWGFLAP